jgi:hypothetical protein
MRLPEHCPRTLDPAAAEAPLEPDVAPLPLFSACLVKLLVVIPPLFRVRQYISRLVDVCKSLIRFWRATVLVRMLGEGERFVRLRDVAACRIRGDAEDLVVLRERAVDLCESDHFPRKCTYTLRLLLPNLHARHFRI